MSEYSTVRYHDGEGFRAALARDGRKLLHMIFISDTGIVHRTEPRESSRYNQPLLYKGAAYPVRRMVRQFREIARARGITEAAKEELKRAAGNVVSSPAQETA